MTRNRGERLLTVKKIDAYLRGSSAAPLHDGGGLYLRRRDGGAYWYLRQLNTATGRRTWSPLFPTGPSAAYPYRPLEAARTAAVKARQLADEPGGADLVRQRAREEHARLEADRRNSEAEESRKRRLTIRLLFERWAATELQPHVHTDGKRRGRKDGGQYTREQFERHIFPTIGERPADEVKKGDLLALLDSQTSAGKFRTANVLFSELKQMFRFAVAREIVDRNPLETITKRDAGGTASARERTLSAEELAQLAAKLPLANLNARAAAAIGLILATGCRVGELMGATWSDSKDSRQLLRSSGEAAGTKFGTVDIAKRSWHLPNTKNQRSHTIHLSDFAVSRFTALAQLRTSDAEGHPQPWVFPSRSGLGPVSVKTFGKQLADRQRALDSRLSHRSRATDALGLPGGRWTAHDLRRTTATLMASLRISGDVIDECLNHVIESKVRRVYVRDRREIEQAAAFDALGFRLSTIFSETSTPSNVVPILRVA